MRTSYLAIATILIALALGLTAVQSEDMLPPAKTPATVASWAFDSREADRRQGAAAHSSGISKEISVDLNDKVSMKLVLIPAGSFLMGSPASDKRADEDEMPLHEVTLSKPFYMGVFDVTRGQFAAFVGATGYRTEAEVAGFTDGWPCYGNTTTAPMRRGSVKGNSWRKTSFPQEDDHPVVSVSWNDAYEFCQWLSKKSGRAISLPAEAQWEWACRAGTETRFPWGDKREDAKGWANVNDKSLFKYFPDIHVMDWDDGYAFTSPVGKFKPNAFGLYDMIGNVTQWCYDGSGQVGWYEVSPKVDPFRSSGPISIVRRGHYGRCIGSPGRFSRTSNIGMDYVGFRVAMEVSPGSASMPASRPASVPAK